MNLAKKRNRQKRGIFLGAMLAVFVVFSIVSIFLVQRTMLKNAQVMGEEIVRSFTTSEDASLYAYELMIENASNWLDTQLENGADTEEISAWMQEYLSYLLDGVGSEGMDMYAAINGKIVAANYWEGDDTFDPTGSPWYQLAMEAGGEVVFTDAYANVVTGKKVVTIAQQVGNRDAVVAVDFYTQHFKGIVSAESLPDLSSFFLCDFNGVLMDYFTYWNAEEEEIQGYISLLLDEIRERGDTDEILVINDFQGSKRAVFYRETRNGWTSIVTIPYSYLTSGLSTLGLWYLGIFVVFLLMAVLMWVRESILNRQVEMTNETVRVLGNSYYAIYRINFEEGRYTMLKGSDYIRSRIAPKGDYLEFMRVIGDVIEKDAYEDFVSSFSIENIRELVKQKVCDYGGDFLRLFNGEYRWVNVRLLFDRSLELDEAVLCFRMVDEEKQRQLRQTQLLKESLDAMKKTAEAKNLFFANMSHDMRTPLNAIIGMSELAGQHLEDPGRTADYLKKINLSSKHLLGLINDILEMSKFEQGKLNLENKPFRLRESIEQAVDIFKIEAKNGNKQFRVAFDIQNDRVVGDFFRIQQVLNNLLSNAMKFTPGGGQISLSVTQLDEGSYPKYRIVVSDTGVGMSEEFLQKIFIPFERETRFGARNISGTGLGMPIVHSIVMQMEGQITVESKLGEGSTFTVILPLLVDEEEEDQTIATVLPQEADLTGCRILVAEDNELNMEISTELLEMLGVEVSQAWNGREAYNLFAQSEEGYFDAVLMDMQMPEMNGCEAARAIRALGRNDARTVPIIAVTANAFAEDIAATEAAGMNAHISKPIDFSVLQKTLERLLAGRQESRKG